MLHYHGTPITPNSVLEDLAGRCFCVSFARPDQVARCHEIGQSVLLDNGAFSIWRRAALGRPLRPRLRAAAAGDWSAFFDWAERWLDYPTTWAVIPDVIDGGVEENDALLRVWRRRGLPKGAPVWHLHEPVDRLRALADSYEKVCLGSSGHYRKVGDPRWRRRMDEAMDALCGSGPVPVWLHLLRGMALSGSTYPLASVDSTNVARNHGREATVSGVSPLEMALRWDRLQAPARWEVGGSEADRGAALGAALPDAPPATPTVAVGAGVRQQDADSPSAILRTSQRHQWGRP